MKKQILSLALILTSGIFFAGFGGTVFAQESEASLYYLELANNKCSSIKKKVDRFENKKAANDFDYTKLSYEKDAYEAELEAYIALENAVSCLKKSGECRTNYFKEDDTNDRISAIDTCFNIENKPRIKVENELEKLKYSFGQFTKSAKLFDQAEELYFGARHLELIGEKIGKNGNRVEGESLDEIMTNNIITRAGGGFIHSTQETISNIFRGSLIKKANRALGTFAILYLFILGVKFIMARGDTERLSSLKGQFAWIMLGLAVISLAEFIGYEVFDPSGKKDVLEGMGARNFKSKAMEVVRFFEYFAGGLMVINALISAYGLIISGEEDEAISKEKQFLKSFLLGTAFILLAEVIVRVLSLQDGSTDAAAKIAVSEVAGLVNFSLSFVGIVGVAMLVMAGLYYVISFGDEEQMGRAKKLIISSIVGVIIAFSAYTIVSFLIV